MINQIDVLDKGFVRLVDSMGNDQRIVDAARVSYSNHENEWDDKRDPKLIRYLMRNRHTSPFEKVRFEFHVKAPKPIAVQFMRHRTGSFNEVSGRYTEIRNEYYIPEEFRTNEGIKNKQGSQVGEFDHEVHSEWAYSIIEGDNNYRYFLKNNVAREQARFVMPYGFYTEFYWTIDLHNLLHFLSLRMTSHAQAEIRWYADALFELAEKVSPIAVEAWYEDVFLGANLRLEEVTTLIRLLDQEELTNDELTLMSKLKGRLKNS